MNPFELKTEKLDQTFMDWQTMAPNRTTKWQSSLSPNAE